MTARRRHAGDRGDEAEPAATRDAAALAPAARSRRPIRTTSSARCSCEMAQRRRRGDRRRASALVVEAGTGVGKTFAYLVPALLSGARALLSTATKTPAGPAVPARPAAPARGARRAGDDRPAQGPRAATCACTASSLARQDAQLPDRFAVRTLAKIEALGADDRERRPRRARGPRRAQQRDPAGHLVARELPRQRMPAVPRLPRQQGAARGDGGRPRGRQPPPVLRRPGAARQRRGRAAAERRGRDLRRGAPARRSRRAVPRHDARHRRS